MLETSITESSKSWSFIRSEIARTKVEYFPKNCSTRDGIQFTLMRCPDDMPIQHTHVQRLECHTHPPTHTDLLYKKSSLEKILATHLHTEPSVKFKLTKCFFQRSQASWARGLLELALYYLQITSAETSTEPRSKRKLITGGRNGL